MASFTKVPTTDVDRYTEGYYYIGPPWAGSSSGEYSQDELRAQGYTTVPGNTDFAQEMIRTGKLVPRLYSQTELAAWGGPPGGWSDYQSSLWGSNPLQAEQQFLVNVPAQYRASSAPILSGGTGVFQPPLGGGYVGNSIAIGEPDPTKGGGIILNGEITRSSLPTRELQELVGGAGQMQSPANTFGGFSALAGGDGIPSWIWIAAAAVAVYLLVKES